MILLKTIIVRFYFKSGYCLRTNCDVEDSNIVPVMEVSLPTFGDLAESFDCRKNALGNRTWS